MLDLQHQKGIEGVANISSPPVPLEIKKPARENNLPRAFSNFLQRYGAKNGHKNTIRSAFSLEVGPVPSLISRSAGIEEDFMRTLNHAYAEETFVLDSAPIKDCAVFFNIMFITKKSY